MPLEKFGDLVPPFGISINLTLAPLYQTVREQPVLLVISTDEEDE